MPIESSQQKQAARQDIISLLSAKIFSLSNEEKERARKEIETGEGLESPSSKVYHPIQELRCDGRDNILQSEILLHAIFARYYEGTPSFRKYHSQNCHVYDVQSADIRTVLKIFEPDATSRGIKEYHLCKKLLGLGLPVPNVFEHDFSNSKYPPHFFQEHLGTRQGEDFATLPNFCISMGRLLAKLHLLDTADISRALGARNVDLSLDKMVSLDLDPLLKALFSAQLIDASLVKKLSPLRPPSSNVEDLCLCHMDYGPWQVIVDGNRDIITGIVDWEMASIASPVIDLARTEVLMTLFGGSFTSLKKGYSENKLFPSNYDEAKYFFQIELTLRLIQLFNNKNVHSERDLCCSYLQEIANQPR